MGVWVALVWSDGTVWGPLPLPLLMPQVCALGEVISSSQIKRKLASLSATSTPRGPGAQGGPGWQKGLRDLRGLGAPPEGPGRYLGALNHCKTPGEAEHSEGHRGKGHYWEQGRPGLESGG